MRPESSTPEPGCCCFPFFGKKSSKKSSKKAKKDKGKGDAKPKKEPKNPESTVPKLPAIDLGGLDPNKLPPKWTHHTAREAKVTRKALRDASLEVASGSELKKGGVRYDLVDFTRPPSRSYRCPKDDTKDIPAPTPESTSRMARMDHFQRIHALEKEMKEKEERRKKALEAKIMRAHRSTERGQKIRDKFIGPMIEAGLHVENVTKNMDFQAWELADSRPGTPVARPPSRAVSRAGLLPKVSNPDLKHKKAEEARARAQQEHAEKAARRRERMEKSRERRHQLEQDQQAVLAKKQAKIKEAAVRRNVVIQDIKMASVLDVSRARHLARMKKINLMFNRAQNGKRFLLAGDTRVDGVGDPLINIMTEKNSTISLEIMSFSEHNFDDIGAGIYDIIDKDPGQFTHIILMAGIFEIAKPVQGTPYLDFTYKDPVTCASLVTAKFQFWIHKLEQIAPACKILISKTFGADLMIYNTCSLIEEAPPEIGTKQFDLNKAVSLLNGDISVLNGANGVPNLHIEYAIHNNNSKMKKGSRGKMQCRYYKLDDGLHPTPELSKQLAQKIYKYMEERV